MKVILIGPVNKRSVVDPSENATVRDVATYEYHLFWRITRRNNIAVSPFTATVVEGDPVTIERK